MSSISPLFIYKEILYSLFTFSSMISCFFFSLSVLANNIFHSDDPSFSLFFHIQRGAFFTSLFLNMIPGKENLSISFSVLTQKKLDKFIRVYHIPEFLNPELLENDRAIYPLLAGNFSFYTRVCNFANYCVPLTKFLRLGVWYKAPRALSRHLNITSMPRYKGGFKAISLNLQGVL
ncbi:hypothetical protein Hanom_Chr03g00267621 [Helianthus anomalus]